MCGKGKEYSHGRQMVGVMLIFKNCFYGQQFSGCLELFYPNSMKNNKIKHFPFKIFLIIQAISLFQTDLSVYAKVANNF